MCLGPKIALTLFVNLRSISQECWLFVAQVVSKCLFHLGNVGCSTRRLQANGCNPSCSLAGKLPPEPSCPGRFVYIIVHACHCLEIILPFCFEDFIDCCTHYVSQVFQEMVIETKPREARLGAPQNIVSFIQISSSPASHLVQVILLA